MMSTRHFNVLWILVVVFVVGIQVFTAVLVYRDAREKKLVAIGWTAMNVFFPFIGIFIYFVLNPRSKYPVQTVTIASDKATKTNTVPQNTRPLDIAQEPTVPQAGSNKTILVKEKHKTAPSVITSLIVKKGPREGQPYEIKDGETLIGRDPGNHIVIDDETVSKSQAIIQKEGETFLIINRSMSNKTKVNGQEIVSQEIKDDDMIQMGDVVLKFWNRKL